MSTARIEKMLKDSFKNFVPVPRLPIHDLKEDPLSKRLRRFDNAKIDLPDANQSGVYINTNESGVAKTSGVLARMPRVEQACHIGFSGWHNFDIIAQRHSSRAVICDSNPENALFLYYVLKYVRACDNRFQFIEKFTDFFKANNYVGLRTNTNRDPWLGLVGPSSIKFCFNVSDEYPYSEHYSIVEEISIELKRESSWLYTDERYAHIKKLALGDKIALITENICAVDTFTNIARLLNENMIQIDTIYVSNIGEWIFTPGDRELFLQTIQSFLSDQETILIDGKINSSLEEATPTQRCITAGELTKSNLKDWFYLTTTQELASRDIESELTRGVMEMSLI